jgi:hypothetical protein
VGVDVCCPLIDNYGNITTAPSLNCAYSGTVVKALSIISMPNATDKITVQCAPADITGYWINAADKDDNTITVMQKDCPFGFEFFSCNNYIRLLYSGSVEDSLKVIAYLK